MIHKKRWTIQEIDFFRKNKLILKKGVKIPQGIDNYGMELVKLKLIDKK